MNRSIARVFWQHMMQHKGLFILIYAGIILANIAELTSPFWYKRFFDALSVPTIGDRTLSVLLGALLLILGANLVAKIGIHMAFLANNRFQPSVMIEIQRTAFSYLLNHSYRFFTNAFTGSLVRKVDRLGRAFERIADEMQWRFTQVTIYLIGGLIVLFLWKPIIGALLFVWILLFIALNVGFARWKMPYDADKADLDSQATGVLTDAVSNHLNVKLFGGHAREMTRYRDVTEKLRRLRTFTWDLQTGVEAAQALFAIAIEFILFYVAAKLWQQGQFTIGDFAFIQAYMFPLFGKLWDIGRSIRNVYEGLADAQEMVEIMEEPIEIQDVRTATPLVVKKGWIQFKEVYFSYNKTRRILSKLTIAVRPGQKVALVGPSGAGKSTITKLLLRFFDVERGEVLIDGQDISRVTQHSLREQIAYVPQEAVLFHRPIMENIRYGRCEATDEEVIEAAKLARCHEFIMELPDGYQTYVGERGVKLSGGERQRVAIARAILKDAPILLLDEATSSLDSESESLIQEALETLMQGKTSIVIAHRLSTIMKMDKIIVMESGRVKAQGSHAALIKRGGLYKRLWNLQAGGFLQ